MNEAQTAALEEISAPRNNNTCWATKLPEEAWEFLSAVEELAKAGTINRRVAAAKFNKLFEIEGKAVSPGMVENHLNKNKTGCTCWKGRDYL